MFRHLFGRHGHSLKSSTRRSPRRRHRHGRRLNLEGLERRDLLTNDAFASAIDLGTATEAASTGLNVGFTAEAGEPAQSGAIQSAWWKWTAPQNGTVTIDTMGSNFDTYLTVATGPAVNSLTVVKQNDDHGGRPQSLLSLDVVGGVTYHIAVDGFGNLAQGAIALNLDFDPGDGGGGGAGPANDRFAERIDLGSTARVNTSGSNVGATGEAGEPAQSGEINSVWWQWHAPANGTLTIDTLGSGFNTFLTVATGTSVNNLTVLAQNDNFDGSPQSQIIVNVTSGIAYHIAVDGFQAVTGAIDLELDFDAAGGGVDNDSFNNRIDLESQPLVQTTSSNVGFTGETGEPEQSGEINSAWWQWTAPANGTVTIDTFGSALDTVLTVATGQTVSDLTTLAQNDDVGGSLQSEVVIDVVAGTRYQIAVDGYQTSTGVFNLNIDFEAIASPTNDSFANRIPLGSVAEVSTNGSNVGFTGEAGEPAQSGAITSAWWQWTAPANGTVTIDTFGSDFDTVLTVATGSAVNTLTLVDQNDDAGGDLQSQLVIDVTGGTRYQIAVDGHQGSTGAIDLNIDFDSGDGANNDFFVNRVNLGSAAQINAPGTNVGFTGEAGEPAQSGAITSAWWQWTAPANGTVTIDTFGSDFDTVLTVATGSAVNTLTLVDQNDDAGGDLQSQLVIDVTGGTRYQIAVDGHQAGTGAIDLNIDFDSGDGANNDLFVNRVDLGSSAQINTTGRNVGFTGEAGELAQSGAITSAWWQWTAPADGKVTIDTFGSDFDTVLTVATGSAVNALTLVDQNDDVQGGLQSQLVLNVIGGTRYQISVDGHQTSTGAIDLNIDFDSVGSTNNDSFSDRVNLGSPLRVDATGTNVDFTGEAGEPPQSGTVNSAWWQWTAPANGTVTIDTFGSDFDTFLTVATGDAVTALTVVGRNDDAGGGLQSQLTIDVTAGTTYQIAVDGYETRTGAIDLNLELQPSSGADNDLFVDRFHLGSGAQVHTAGKNIDFSGEIGEPAQSGTINSAWWQWTAPANGTVTIDTFGSNFDTFLTVATGTAVNALTVLARNDDTGGQQSQVVIDATAGTNYHIAVDGFQAATGVIDLNIRLDGSSGGGSGGNDLFADRISLGSATGIQTTGSNVNFTGEIGEPAQSGTINSAWWQWTAPANGIVTLDTFGSNFDTFLTVAQGNRVGGLTIVGQNDNAGGLLQSALQFEVIAGTTYRIAVDGAGSATGAIDLNLMWRLRRR